ncbi:hypothetical protein AB9P05_10435 [Roseivirga sp. BDSF3-8]|uniref:MutS-related protein n=1 Tax=Roseivirga sp. BDSF3-8 TaxID=3241598 RepID=UPI003531CD71
MTQSEINKDSITYFTGNQKAYNEVADKLNRQYNQLSIARALFFLVMMVGFIYLVDTGQVLLLLGTLVAYFFAFGALINWHHKVRFRRDHARAKAEICGQELQRLDLRFEGLDEGMEYLDQGHAYAYDLDVFGRKSLFQWLNRTVTKMGRDGLAGALLTPSGRKEVALRQEAARELAEMPEWRLEFGAFGWPYRREVQDTAPFLQWMQEEDEPLPGWIRVVSYVLPLLTLSAIIGFFTGILPAFVPLLFLVLSGGLIKRGLKQVQDTEEYTVASLKAMEGYEKLIHHTLQAEYSSERLRVAVAKLQAGDGAGPAIHKLKRLFSYMESRRNFFYQLLNAVFLVDIHLLQGFRGWKRQHRSYIGGWLEAIGTFDFLSSLGGASFAQPELTWPEVADREYVTEGRQLGHPLIAAEARVNNDFSFSGQGSVLLVTGSNMSGKSTFLRTVGLNVVLALAGAPVCASSLHTGEIQVFTSMRTQDNLEESVSGFYAELKRLRQLLDLLKETDRPVLFLLDEILKGTNSEDRHKGSEGLIRQLSRMQGFGMVSTHDLTLGHLEESMPNLKNVSFNSRIENGKLIFDYTLTPGLCRSFNASKLMEDIGIEVA